MSAGVEASAREIAAWAARLVAAGVPWPPVHQAAVAARLGGIQRLVAQGRAAFEGDATQRAVLLDVIREAARRPRGADSLARVAATLRLMHAMAPSERSQAAVA